MKARLTEIMESVQGEGLLVGSRQVFLRFSGCNLRCSYCDTLNSIGPEPNCRVSLTAGRGDIWQYWPNPLSMDQIIKLLSNYNSRWISLTGGEPLLWADFISELGKRLKPQGYSFLLETNGILYDQLDLCLSCLDMISMDFKLPSATGEDNWSKHSQFLERAFNKPIYIKIVVDTKVKEWEIQEAVKIIAAVNSNIPLILQPVTPIAGIYPPDMDTILNLQKMCLQDLRDVRIIPQIHKYIGLI